MADSHLTLKALIMKTAEGYDAFAECINEFCRQQSSVIYSTYNILKKIPEDERKGAQEYYKEDSVVRQHLAKMNNIEKVNYILRNSAISRASSMVSADESQRKSDNNREKKYLKDKEKNDKDLKKFRDKREKLLNKKKDIEEQLKGNLTEKKRISLNKKRSKVERELADGQLHKKINRLVNKNNALDRKLSNIENRRKDNYTRKFGGAKLFEQYKSGKITKEEFKKGRLHPLYCVGDKEHGNRVLDIKADGECTFKPSENEHYTFFIDIKSMSSKQRKTFQRIVEMVNNHELALTISLSDEALCLTYDIDAVFAEERAKYKYVKNRFLAFDSNIDNLGVAVVDWISPGVYKIIATMIFSIKELNDEWFAFNKEGDVASDVPRRIKNSNSRRTQIGNIVSAII